MSGFPLANWGGGGGSELWMSTVTIFKIISILTISRVSTFFWYFWNCRVVVFRVNLEYLERVNFKIFFHHGEKLLHVLIHVS